MLARVGSMPVTLIVLLMLLVGFVYAGCTSSNKPESAAAGKRKKHLALYCFRPDRSCSEVIGASGRVGIRECSRAQL
jgi:hypothetical protein